MRTCILLVSLLVACGGGTASQKPKEPVGNGGETADPADPTDQTDDAVIDQKLEQLIGLMKDAANQMLAAEGCDGRAAAMTGWLGAHRTEVETIMTELRQYPREQVKEKAEGMFRDEEA